MNLSDPLGDLLTRIRNAQSGRRSQVVVTYSKLHENVLEVLKREGYIRAWSTEDVRTGIKTIRVELKYSEGEPAIREINRRTPSATCRRSMRAWASRSSPRRAA